MNDSQEDTELRELDHAICLAEAALAQCDKAGLIWPAIDVSSALDKLRALRKEHVKQ
jgi:hypothetical protein